MRGYNQDHKPDHPYRLVFTQETQHLLGVHDHEEAKALLEGAGFGVDIAETDPSTGKIWLYVGDRRGGERERETDEPVVYVCRCVEKW